MFNNYLVDEQAKQEIKRRAQEAETYSLHKRLGYGDSRAARWVLAFIMLLVVVAALGLL
jgi:hypothetical protein